MVLVLNQNSFVYFTCLISHFVLQAKLQVLLHSNHPETIIEYFVTNL